MAASADGGGGQPSEAEKACWICLGSSSDGELSHLCSCPADRVVHKSCLARWQLQSAGRSEEHRCRFCHALYPSWKDSLTPPNFKQVTPVVAVQYNGNTFRLRIRPGPEGLAAFQRQLQRITGISQLDAVAITFQCRAPETSAQMRFRGMDAFDAAMHCASITASERQQRADQREAGAAGAGAGASEGAAPSSSAATGLPSPCSSSSGSAAAQQARTPSSQAGFSARSAISAPEPRRSLPGTSGRGQARGEDRLSRLRRRQLDDAQAGAGVRSSNPEWSPVRFSRPALTYPSVTLEGSFARTSAEFIEAVLSRTSPGPGSLQAAAQRAQQQQPAAAAPALLSAAWSAAPAPPASLLRTHWFSAASLSSRSRASSGRPAAAAAAAPRLTTPALQRRSMDSHELQMVDSQLVIVDARTAHDPRDAEGPGREQSEHPHSRRLKRVRAFFKGLFD